MVDYNMYRALHPPEEEKSDNDDESRPPPSIEDLSPDDPAEHEDYLLLLPAQVRAFSFADKKWGLYLSVIYDCHH